MKAALPDAPAGTVMMAGGGSGAAGMAVAVGDSGGGSAVGARVGKASPAQATSSKVSSSREMDSARNDRRVIDKIVSLGPGL